MSGFIGQNFGEGLGGGSSAVTSDTSLALTYSDVVARLMDRIGSSSSDIPEERKAKRAIRDALRDLPTKNAWNYYTREWQFFTSPLAVLNITYTHSSRVAVVNSGTIPSDVIYGHFFYNGIRCEVDSVSGSNLTLNSNANPGENLTNVSVNWVRQHYPSPMVTKFLGLFRTNETRSMQYVSPSEITYRDIILDSGVPVVYSVVNSSTLGRSDVVISPAPSTRQSYRASAIVAPSQPTVYREQGEASGGGGELTFTSPEATSAWLGCVVRAAPSSSNKLDDIINEDWTWQAVITGVSGTTVTVDTALPVALDDEVILVSSLIDIDRESMQTYFESLAYTYYARNMSNKDREAAESLSLRLFREALAADSRADRSTRHGSVYSRYNGVFPDLRFAGPN